MAGDQTAGDQGGDPACWLNRVCDNCGRFIDDPHADACPECGAPRDDHEIRLSLDDLAGGERPAETNRRG